MGTNERMTAVGVFESRDEAENAINELMLKGFRDEQIGLAVRDPEQDRVTEVTADKATGAGEGLATGAVIGGLLGAAAALLIPGIGPVVAGGVLAGVLSGAALGAAAGGLLGALVGMGVPEEEAAYYDQEFQSGRTIVTVKTDGRYDEAQEVLRRHSSYDIGTRPTDRETAVAMPADSNETGTDVHAYDRTPTTTPHLQPMAAATDTDKAESPMAVNTVSQGAPVVSEELRYGRAADHEVKQDAPQFRKYDQAVQSAHRTDDGTVETWEQAMPRYREHWESNYQTLGSWEEYEPQYKFSWEMGTSAQYRTRPWGEVEGDLRRDWEKHYIDRPWDRVHTFFHDTWDYLHMPAPRV